jgi:hypothetical protein
MADREPPVVDEHGDFIFRFSLDELPQAEPVYGDALTEMVREQLEALLDVVEVTRNGEPVAVDGFRFLNDPATVYRIFRTSTSHLPSDDVDQNPGGEDRE